MTHVLIVEDDKHLRQFLRKALREEGVTVEEAASGAAALEAAASKSYDCIVLDVMLPERDGFDVLTTLRAAGVLTPILMLTARAELAHRVRGLESGADDYLAKPFRFDVLLARIRALHRRGGAARLDVLKQGTLSLDRLHHQATSDGKTLDLTPKEFQLLEYFLQHTEEVVRRTTLLEKVWDMHFDPESNVVDVHVGNLRRKLDQAGASSRIVTVRGVGFSLRPAAQA